MRYTLEFPTAATGEHVLAVIEVDAVIAEGLVVVAVQRDETEQNALSPSDHLADAAEALDDTRDAFRAAVGEAFSDASEAALCTALAHLRAAGELLRVARKVDAS